MCATIRRNAAEQYFPVQQLPTFLFVFLLTETPEQKAKEAPPLRKEWQA